MTLGLADCFGEVLTTKGVQQVISVLAMHHSQSIVALVEFQMI